MSAVELVNGRRNLLAGINKTITIWLYTFYLQSWPGNERRHIAEAFSKVPHHWKRTEAYS